MSNQNEIKIKSHAGMESKGIHTISVCKMTSDYALKLQELIENVRIKRQFVLKTNSMTPQIAKDLNDEYHYFLEKLHSMFKLREYVIENITTTEGRTALADVIANIGTYTGHVTHTALGSSATAAAITDTQLGTEVYRKALSSGSKLNNVAYLETFFTASEVTGTFQEYGNFMDATGAANSGQILNRFTQAVTKSGVESLNVQSTITLNDA